MDKDLESDTNWTSIQWKPNTYFIFDCSYWQKARTSIFPTSFQESWKNLKHIFNLKYNVEPKFHVHAGKVSSNMRSCLRFFPPLLFRTQKVVFQLPSWASIMKSFKRPISIYHGNRELEEIGKQHEWPATADKNHGCDYCAMILVIVGTKYKLLVQIMFFFFSDTSFRPFLCHWRF